MTIPLATRQQRFSFLSCRPCRARTGQITLETALILVFVVAGLALMGFYLQRAMQGGLFGASQAIGLQFDPRDFYQETQQLPDMTETVHEACTADIVCGAMIEAQIIPQVIPDKSVLMDPLDPDGGGIGNPNRLLNSLPTGPVPREPAILGSEVTANWKVTRDATYDDAR